MYSCDQTILIMVLMVTMVMIAMMMIVMMIMMMMPIIRRYLLISSLSTAIYSTLPPLLHFFFFHLSAITSCLKMTCVEFEVRRRICNLYFFAEIVSFIKNNTDILIYDECHYVL